MRITILTSDQPRHISLINTISEISEKVWVIIEEKNKKNNLSKYFECVAQAEKNTFKNNKTLNRNIKTIKIKNNTLNELKRIDILETLNSDYYIVFGTSLIKGWLLKELIANKTLNIHLGISPYYRGSACNFWSIYDNNPHLTGASIQKLSSKVDDGEILYHAIPNINKCNTVFDFSMRAALAAQITLKNKLKKNIINKTTYIDNNDKKIIRVCWRKNFNERIADQFLKNNDFKKIKNTYFEKFEKKFFHNMEVY